MSSERIGYVVKVYPRFSETFVVTEILAREVAGEDIEIFALRPTTDTHFHASLASVRAPVRHLGRPTRPSQWWALMCAAREALTDFDSRWAEAAELSSRMDADEVAQALDLAVRVVESGITHLHAHFASAQARVAALAAALVGITYSVTVHAKDAFHEDVDVELLSLLLTRADHVITISRFHVRYLRELAPAARVHLVANGIDLEAFSYREPQPPAGPLQVLAVGRLVEKKGFGPLLQAVREAREAGTEMQLQICGGGELEAELRELCTRWGLDDIVTWLGACTQDRVAALMRSADVFVAPCVIGVDGNVDGVPTVLLEAMAVGTPSISTAVTGIPELVSGTAAAPDTGILLEPGDIDALVDALAQVAAADFPRREVSLRARLRVETAHDSRRQASRLAALTPNRPIPMEVAR
ncbi:glycosyltransferase family 4 protein [Dermacoccaceae bacterium W4C1]